MGKSKKQQSKKHNSSPKPKKDVNLELNDASEIAVESEEIMEPEAAAEAKEIVVSEKSDKKDNKKVEKTTKKEERVRRSNKVVKKGKEVISELKKVTWPSFAQVVKKTSVVLAVVIFFLLVLFGIDRLLEFLFRLLMGQ